MTMHFRSLADQAMADGSITAEEILDLRRAGWGDGAIHPEEAEALFVLNDHLKERTAAWTDFFVEALGEFIVNGSEPRGYVSDEQAAWLIARVDHDGRVDSMAELELLVRVAERALNAPQALKEFILAQVERAVMTGEGPTRSCGAVAPGAITPAECAILRRLVFASGGDGPGIVSRAEAEALFRLKDASLGKDNAPEWQQLFVQALGNHLMAHGGHTPLSQARAAELESFMNDATPHLGRFVGRVARSGIANSFGKVFGRKPVDGPDLSDKVTAALAITATEQMWLQNQIDANDQVDAFDQALLDFIARETTRG